jgi:drug/metabolite transporter (DMT)-like permease
MEQSAAQGASYAWLGFAAITVASWGVYGLFLHSGQGAMGDPAEGRLKAFLFVGLAYFITAVLAPILLLWLRGASWTFSGPGMAWSLLAGAVGALGAFCVLLAFGARGTPAVVMSIVFAGAPIVNAVVSLLWHPPAGGVGSIRWPFFVGILLAAVGGCLVTLYKPNPGPPRAQPAEARITAAEES